METLKTFKVSNTINAPFILNFGLFSHFHGISDNLYSFEGNFCHPLLIVFFRIIIGYKFFAPINYRWMKMFKSTSARILQYFLQGLLILAPIAVTFYLIVQVFTWLDNLIPIYINIGNPGDKPFYLPGIGFLLVIGSILAVGYLSSIFFVGRAIHVLEHWMEKTPGIKLVYTLVKDFSEAFVGKKRKFTKTVLVSIYDKDVYQLGFITNEDLKEFGLKEHISVYVPLSYALTGTLFFVKPERVKLLPEISGQDAYKFAISGGVAEVEE